MMGLKVYGEKELFVHTVPSWKHWVRQNSKSVLEQRECSEKRSEFLNLVIRNLIGVNYS